MESGRARALRDANFKEVAARVRRGGGVAGMGRPLHRGRGADLEHMFGEFHGREEIYDWISSTMAQWPNSAMTSFPHDWCICDEERGWWVCQIENRFRDRATGLCTKRTT